MGSLVHQHRSIDGMGHGKQEKGKVNSFSNRLRTVEEEARKKNKARVYLLPSLKQFSS